VTAIWIHLRVRLVDPQHKKPDRTRVMLIAPHIVLEEILEKARGIETLIKEGYIIEDWVVTNG